MKVTVLIYVLNGLPYIERCVRSVMSQTLQEIEILVIDGGSTDGTLEIIKNLLYTDERIRLIHSGPGVGLQFNTGLKEAKGEYIGICESDDYLLPDMYERQYALAKQYQLDILRADANHFIENNRGEEFIFPVKLSKQDDLYDQVLDLTKDRRILELGINGFWSGLYRRKFLLEEHIFMNETKGAAYQDTTFSFLAEIKGKRVMLSRMAFYCYRLDNPGSSMNAPRSINTLIEEYGLLQTRLKEIFLFEEYRDNYISWKIKGYLAFYDIFRNEQKKEYVNLICNDIKADLLSGDFEEKGLSLREKEAVKKITHSEKAFEEYLGSIYEKLETMKQRLEEIPEGKKIIIFGCGEFGKMVYLYMTYMGRRIDSYIDNNSEQWGRELNGISVLQPQNAVKLFPNAVYVVANVEHHNEMRDQLIKNSIHENNIILCDDYIFFFKHILLKAIKE